MKYKKVVKTLLSLLLGITLLLPIASVKAVTDYSYLENSVERIVLELSETEGVIIGDHIYVDFSVDYTSAVGDINFEDAYKNLIQWHSSDDNILQVVKDSSISGAFVVNGYGSVTITATIGGKSDSIIVNVTRPVEELNEPVDGISEVHENFTIKNGILIKYRGVGGEVTIPDTVIEIASGAFWKTKVTKVTMSNNVRYIGDSAFGHCKKLKSIRLSENLEYVGEEAFSSCISLTEIKIPNKVRQLGELTFYGCSKLSQISIPKSINTIGSSCFLETKWLTNQKKKNSQVIVNGILIGIDLSKHSGKVYISKNVKHINPHILDVGDNVRELIIPNSVISIGEYTFQNCNNLEKVTVPNSVTSIGEGAFSGCNHLEKINIPKSVKVIGGSSFLGTKWLKNQQKKNPLVIVNGILIDGTTSKGKVIIPNTVKYINDNAFKSSYGIQSRINEIVISSSVKGIGKFAFWGCINLEKIAIPKSISSIGSSCFGETKWISNQQKRNPLVIVNGILIDGRTSKGNITIPNSVKYINDNAFSYCNNLKSISMTNSVVGIGNEVFYSCQSLYKIKLSENILYMGNGVFESCTSLKEVTLPSHLRKLPDLTFRGCHSLVKVKISQSNIFLGHEIFTGTAIASNQGDTEYGDIKVVLFGKNDSDVEKYANTYSIPFESMSSGNTD